MDGKIAAVSSVEEARELQPEDFLGKVLLQEDLVHLLKIFKAFWEYPGEPCSGIPHAELRTGKHSNGFINCLAVLVESNLCEILGYQMSRIIAEAYDNKIDWVVSAAYSGIDLGHEMARFLSARHAFTEKDTKGDPTIWKRHAIQEGEIVLIANELMTNGNGSTWHIKKAIMEQNPIQPVKFVPAAGVLVNRSPKDEELEDGTQVLSLGRFKMDVFDPGPETCPYCQEGSLALKPKVGNNWQNYFSVK